MKQLLVSLGIFVRGGWVLNACWRDYRERTAETIADDLWNLASHRMIGVVFWALVTVAGFAMLAVALAPGEVFDYSPCYPFVTWAKPVPAKP